MKMSSYRAIGVVFVIVCLIGGECKPLLDELENDGSTTGISTVPEDDMTEGSLTTTIPFVRLPRLRRNAATSSPEELTSTLATEAETIVPRSRRDAGTTLLQELTSTLAMVTETIVARSRRDAATTFLQELTSTLATPPETILPINESLISTSVAIDTTVQPMMLNELLNINGLQSLLLDNFNESQQEETSSLILNELESNELPSLSNGTFKELQL